VGLDRQAINKPDEQTKKAPVVVTIGAFF